MRAAAIPSTLGALALALAPAAAAAPPGGDHHRPGRATEAAGVTEAAEDAEAAGIRWGRCPAAEHLPRSVECGTVRVPVDYTRPDDAHLSLTVSRARPPENPAGDWVPWSTTRAGRAAAG